MIILDTTEKALLNLTLFDIIVLGIAIISLGLNVIQLLINRKRQQALIAPLSNSIIALFNDIKTKKTTVIMNQQLIRDPKNPHEKIETLKYDYDQFTQNVVNYLQGFQEALVGVLVTLNPNDKEGKKAFKASDYGLTQEEKKQRDKYAKLWVEQQKAPRL